MAGACSGEERVAGIEAAGDGVIGGASKVVRARDPDEQFDADSGTFQLAGKPPVALGGGSVPDEQRRGQMMLDERRDLVGERTWRPHPLEQRAGRGHPLDIVSMRSDPAIDSLCGRRLAEVVAERAEHQLEILAAAVVWGSRPCRRLGRALRAAFAGAGVTAAQGGRHVEDHEGVHPHVALRVPLGILRDAAQGVDLGEEAELARVLEHPEAERRLRRAKQQLLEFVEHPFAGQLAQIELPAQGNQRVVRRHFEPGRELGGAQAA